MCRLYPCVALVGILMMAAACSTPPAAPSGSATGALATTARTINGPMFRHTPESGSWQTGDGTEDCRIGVGILDLVREGDMMVFTVIVAEGFTGVPVDVASFRHVNPTRNLNLPSGEGTRIPKVLHDEERLRLDGGVHRIPVGLPSPSYEAMVLCGNGTLPSQIDESNAPFWYARTKIATVLD